MMTLDEIEKALQGAFPDEIQDSNSYCDMAKSAETMGDRQTAKYLYAIAKDEYTHAKFIHEYMIDNGLPIPDIQEKAWKELSERANRTF